MMTVFVRIFHLWEMQFYTQNTVSPFHTAFKLGCCSLMSLLNMENNKCDVPLACG